MCTQVKPDSWCIEHAEFLCGSTTEGTPDSSGFSPPLFPQGQEKGKTQTHYTLTIKRPFKYIKTLPMCFTRIKSYRRLRFIVGVCDSGRV